MNWIETLEFRLMCRAWYVATNGRESNPGTLRKPFVTIQEAANVAQPGDTVFIRRGVYRESVIPAHSGTAGSPITFRSYGKEQVTIDGSDPVTGGSFSSDGIFTAAVTESLGEGEDEIFSGGVMINEAQWPASAANTSTTLSIPATAIATGATLGPTINGKASATLSIPSLQDAANAWVGATIHFAAGQQWVFQTGTVIASSRGSVTFTFEPLAPYSYQMPSAGTPFYLTGTAAAFNDGGQWFIDPATGTLSLRSGALTASKNPEIDMKHRLYAFDLSGLSYINVTGLRLFACTINTSDASSNLVLSALNAFYVSQDMNLTDPWSHQFHPHTTGIILNGTNNLLQNSTIAFSSGDGVFLGGSNNTVQNCIIHDVDYAGGDEAGVSSLGTSNQILFNTIFNCSRSGIVVRFSPHVSVLHNRVAGCGLQTTDLGGIYAWGTDGQGSEIAYNVISDIRTGGFGGIGVYLDNGSMNYIVDHNVTWNVDAAAKINPPDGNNVFYNNTLIGVTDSLASSGGGDMSGDQFINNVFTAALALSPDALVANNLEFTTDPMFMNPARNDYRLKRKSPAIDAGQTIVPYATAARGKAPDIGAYEYGLRPFRVGSTLRSAVH